MLLLKGPKGPSLVELSGGVKLKPTNDVSGYESGTQQGYGESSKPHKTNDTLSRFCVLCCDSEFLMIHEALVR